ncbi:hypothetical protein [Stutzerimonas stutzeri]|nr:hypothetical protein [Stutzerimonas stutzeri]MDH0425359.1 hypothetical protein [Stutzerimonas stutzeri]
MKTSRNPRRIALRNPNTVSDGSSNTELVPVSGDAIQQAGGHHHVG